MANFFFCTTKQAARKKTKIITIFLYSIFFAFHVVILNVLITTAADDILICFFLVSFGVNNTWHFMWMSEMSSIIFFSLKRYNKIIIIKKYNKWECHLLKFACSFKWLNACSLIQFNLVDLDWMVILKVQSRSVADDILKLTVIIFFREKTLYFIWTVC